jgi:hypothetical protein
MKKFFPFILILVFFSLTGMGQSVNEKKDPVGKWKFEAPYAPEGYSKGTIDIGFAEDKFTANMAFTDLDYTFPGEKIKVQNDSVYFMIWIESTDVSVSLKMEDKSTMTGTAVYVDGTVPLTLTKEPVEKQE